jgi:hypothetical protein
MRGRKGLIATLRTLVALLGIINFYFGVVQLTRLVDSLGSLLYFSAFSSVCLLSNAALCFYFAGAKRR